MSAHRLPIYEWTVILRNEQQGYAKTCQVPSDNYAGAVNAAMEVLRDRGYKLYQFQVITVQRNLRVIA